jgi:hypothetical protein
MKCGAHHVLGHGDGGKPKKLELNSDSGLFCEVRGDSHPQLTETAAFVAFRNGQNLVNHQQKAGLKHDHKWSKALNHIPEFKSVYIKDANTEEIPPS